MQITGRESCMERDELFKSILLASFLVSCRSFSIRGEGIVLYIYFFNG
jgi:hypothetical protein